KGLMGKLINKNTKAVISNSPVQFQDLKGGLVAQVNSDSEGVIKAAFEDQETLNVIVDLPEFFPYQETIQLSDATQEFKIELIPRPEWGIYGSVYLLPDMKAIPEVTLQVEPVDADAYSVVSGADGQFKAELKPETDYSLVFTKKGYFTKRTPYSTVNRDSGYVNVNEFMQLEMQKAEVGASIEIEILYDLGKWNIREDAATELDDMIQFLKDNPGVKIELGSHTDSRGSAQFNQRLSQKRAESAVTYMVNRGIDKSRVIAKGYGETR
ncbi:OmpA family protein, partial [Plebeiibacterium sediminum]